MSGVLGHVLGCVHPHIHATVFGLFMPHTPPLDAFADGIFFDTEPASSLLYRYSVLGCVPVLSHEGHARALGPVPKALVRRHPRIRLRELRKARSYPG